MSNINRQAHIAQLATAVESIQTFPAGDLAAIGTGIADYPGPVETDSADGAAVEAYFGKGGNVDTAGPSVSGDTIDTAEANDMSILQRDGKYLLALNDSSVIWDSFWSMRHAFLIWLLNLTEADTLVIDPYQGLSGERISPYWVVESATVFGVIDQSPAKVVVRVSGLLGGISAYLALAADELQVGDMGELVIAPLTRMSANACTQAYVPFFDGLLKAAVERQVLTEEEYDTLASGKDMVTLSVQTLRDRGIAAA